MNKIFRSRAPLRLGIAGGGTDVSPYCDVFGGYVLNSTIDRFVYAQLITTRIPKIKFVATDLDLEFECAINEVIELDGTLNLHKAVYLHMINNFNHGEPISLELKTFTDAPLGSGLGTSSTLVVAMITVFVELLNLPLDDYEIALIAYQIERIECGLQGGKQDQYSATFGGFNFMEFYADNHTVITPLRIKDWIKRELESSLLLFHTGVSRESARIISDQSSNVSSKQDDAIEAMHGIKNEAITMKNFLLRGDFSGIEESMKLGWENKKKSAKSVSSPWIDEIYESALKSGARAGKISGAGGGGFMLFLVPIENRFKLMQTLIKFDGTVDNCHFTSEGAQAWRIK